jgi:hypothetical protein
VDVSEDLELKCLPGTCDLHGDDVGACDIISAYRSRAIEARDLQPAEPGPIGIDVGSLETEAACLSAAVSGDLGRGKQPARWSPRRVLRCTA